MNLSELQKSVQTYSQKSMDVHPIIGIDLGTTNCAVAVYTASDVPTLLPIGGPGRFTMPSCVMWNGDEDFTIGLEAYNRRYQSNVIYSVKRQMGTDSVITLRLPDNEGNLKNMVLNGDNIGGNEKFVCVRQFTPAEVSGLLLSELKKRTEQLYGPVEKAVITVPAYFNHRQIEDTLQAGKLAGLDVVNILKEPTSASYVYSQLGYTSKGSVLVYDLGGGTFDATYLNFLRKDTVPEGLLAKLKEYYGIELQNRGADSTDQYFCRVIATFGDTHLGGDDIDRLAAESTLRRNGVEMVGESFEKLVLRCEEFKKLGAMGMTVNIDGVELQLSVEDVNYGVKTVFNKTMKLMGEFNKGDAQTVVLVGGSTKNLKLRELLQLQFPQAEISCVLDPDAAVALGAGAVAKSIANDETGMLYQDVLPLPIGVLVDNDHVEFCVQANTPLPYSTKVKYRTIDPKQEELRIEVFQGQDRNPGGDTYLGRVTVAGLPPQEGEKTLNIEITFILNAVGQLRVISNVEGVAKEEELVIENIFSVENQQEEEEMSELVPQDSFEEAFLEMALGNEELLALIIERRRLSDDDSKREELETKIIELL